MRDTETVLAIIRTTGAPDALKKARPVRGGADEKGPATAPRQPPTPPMSRGGTAHPSGARLNTDASESSEIWFLSEYNLLTGR